MISLDQKALEIMHCAHPPNASVELFDDDILVTTGESRIGTK